MPEDPTTPATKGQTIVVGVASAVAGVGFLVCAGLMIVLTHSSGRLMLLPVIFLNCVTIILGVGFLDVAFALLRKKEKRRAQLFGNFTLYLAGGFLIFVPLFLLFLGLVEGSDVDLRILGGVSLGLLAIRLAWVRKKKTRPPPAAAGR